MTDDVPGQAAPAAASLPDSTPWLVLIYRIPSEPTRLRATVWRRLKGLGAVYLQNSVAALPAGSSSERALRKLRREILDMGGTAQLLASQALAGQSDILAVFQRRAVAGDERDLAGFLGWIIAHDQPPCGDAGAANSSGTLFSQIAEHRCLEQGRGRLLGQ